MLRIGPHKGFVSCFERFPPISSPKELVGTTSAKIITTLAERRRIDVFIHIGIARSIHCWGLCRTFQDL